MNNQDSTKCSKFSVTEEELYAWRQALPEHLMAPPGFRTIKEWAEIWQLSEAYTNRACLKLKAIGRMETGKFRKNTGIREQVVTHWKLVKPKGKK